MSCSGVTSIGSKAAPITRSLPEGPRPSINWDIDFEFGAVARMTCAPPSFWSSAAAKRIEGGNTRTEKRGGFGSTQAIGYRRQRLDRREHIFLISTVVADA